MSFQDKVKQRIQEKTAEIEQDNQAEVEPFVKSEFFGVENVRNFPPCLELRLVEGNSKAIQYSYIQEMNFDPSEGIEIITMSKKVAITGRNLKVLYIYLLAFRVKFIKANKGNDLMEESLLFVKEIKIEEI